MSEMSTLGKSNNPENTEAALALIAAARRAVTEPQITVASMTDGNEARLHRTTEEARNLDLKSVAARKQKQQQQQKAKQKLMRLAFSGFNRGGKGNNHHHNNHSNRQYTWTNRGR